MSTGTGYQVDVPVARTISKDEGELRRPREQQGSLFTVNISVGG